MAYCNTCQQESNPSCIQQNHDIDHPFDLDKVYSSPNHSMSSKSDANKEENKYCFDLDNTYSSIDISSSLESKISYRSFCEKCGTQYFSDYEEHEKVCNEGVLIFSKNCAFSNDLKRFCNLHKVLYRQIDSDDIWVRDYFIQGENKLLIRNKDYPFSSHKDILENNNYIKKFNNMYMYDARRHPSAPGIYTDRSINKDLFTNDYRIESSKKALEGGNLFICKNKLGKVYYLIGETAIWSDIAIAENNGKKISVEDVLDKYSYLFGCVNESIVVIPNLSFHIDLQMAYIGNSHFILNYYTYKNYVDKKIYEAKYNKVLDIFKLLKKYYFDVTINKALMFNKEKPLQWDTQNIESNLINGIHIFSNTKKVNYFLTVDTQNMSHRINFKNFLNKLNIRTEFLNINDSNNFSSITQEYIREYKGGLRCQTNFVHNLALKDIAATKIQSAYKSYIYSKKYKDDKIAFANKMHKSNHIKLKRCIKCGNTMAYEKLIGYFCKKCDESKKHKFM